MERQSRWSLALRGFILLEVVLSLALLVMGMTYIGAQIQNAQATAYETEALTRILMLVEMKLAELDTGLINLDEEADNEVEGDFTRRIPDYGWRMRFDPTVTEGLRAITLDILYAPRLILDEEFDVDEAETVHTVYTLRAIPGRVDLQSDFGFTEEAIETLSETSPIDADWSDFDLPGVGRDADMEEVIDFLLAMIEASGQSIDQLASLLPKEFSELLKLRSEFAGFGDAEDEESADVGLGDGASANPREAAP